MKGRKNQSNKSTINIPETKGVFGKEKALFPGNIRELLSMYNRNPGGIIFAGGTVIMRSRLNRGPKRKARQGPVISLKHVQELARVVRRERFLEIGAAVPLSKIVSIGSRVVPKTLYNAVFNYGYLGVRNLATLGGLICSPWDFSEILTILYALDTQLEIRSINHTGWILISSFKKANGENILSENEVLTRIRIPYNNWNRSFSRIVGMDGSSTYPKAVFSGFARVEKDSIEDIRLSFGCIKNTVIRERSIEMTLQGKKLPLTEKDLSLIDNQISDLFNNYLKGEEFKKVEILATPASINPENAYRQATVRRIMLRFLKNLEYPDYLEPIAGLQNRQSKLYF